MVGNNGARVHPETITRARPPEMWGSEVGIGASRAVRRPKVFSPIRDTSPIDGEQLLQFWIAKMMNGDPATGARAFENTGRLIGSRWGVVTRTSGS